jgi:ABC-type polysaccharide transport system permease subunit
MKATALSLITVACLVWASTACDLLPRGEANQLLTEVADQEQKWLEKDIDSYRIVVLHVSSVWHAQTQEITVRLGKVVDESASCIPAPTEDGKCEVEPFDAEEYTVPGLFELARSLALFDDGQWTEIEFDSVYGYPAGMSYDHPEIVDEDSYWGVRSFEVLD